MRDSNVGLGMVPHKKSCKCDECIIERQAEQIEQLQAALTELVRLKDLREKGFESNNDLKKYRKEKPLAWDVARKVLGVDQDG